MSKLFEVRTTDDERNEDIVRALAAFSIIEPVGYQDGGERLTCRLCEANAYTKDHIFHDDDCPWRRAREAYPQEGE